MSSNHWANKILAAHEAIQKSAPKNKARSLKTGSCMRREMGAQVSTCCKRARPAERAQQGMGGAGRSNAQRDRYWSVNAGILFTLVSPPHIAGHWAVPSVVPELAATGHQTPAEAVAGAVLLGSMAAEKVVGRAYSNNWGTSECGVEFVCLSPFFYLLNWSI